MKRLTTLFVVVALLVPLSATAPATAEPTSFERVYASRARVVCHVPRSGNAQRSVGFDTGFSFVYNGAAYWAFGDSLVDGNGDGMFHGPDEPLGFRTGSVGRTTDLVASNCVNVQLRTTNGRNVLPVFNPDKANGECLVWPNRIFEADGKLYFFYTSVQRQPDCEEDRPTTYQLRLGQLTNPATGELAPVRVGGPYTYSSPVKAGQRIYLFNVSDGALRMARVNEKRVANRAHYEYWNGSAWVPDESAAAVVADGVDSGPTIAYNAYAGRYLMVYTCGIWARGLCARTATVPGPEQQALFGGWNEETQIYECEFFTCGHGYWHSGYTDPAQPQKIYVSTAHFPSRSYFVTLREIDLSATPPAAGTIYAEAEHDFSAPPATNNWQYMSYSRFAPGTDLQALTTKAQSPPSPSGARFAAWVGTENVDGEAAPGVFPLGQFPSATRGAARVWTAPGPGTVSVSGEAWVESTRGDKALAEVLLVSANGSVTKLWRKNLAANWAKSRSKRLVNLQGIPVAAGDRVIVGVRAGNSPLKSASHDLTYFPVSLTYEP